MERATRPSWLALAFAAAIFASAFLLFQIQPLAGKQILPQFGGSPAVWTTCLLFFQTLLFAGYLYAHCSNTWLQPKAQAALHLFVLAVAVAFLFGMSGGRELGVAASHHPVRDILLMLGSSLGLPYFALAATGPLLQAWFARAFPGRVPYRLYALSNFGSLLALLSYPFVVEQRFTLPQQNRIWSWAFFAFAVLCGLVAARIWSLGQQLTRTKRDELLEPAERPHWLQYVAWLVWPALASVVLMATTNHICTDVAVIPFLWVAPLALYLVTFIIVFDHPRWYRPATIATFTLIAIYGTALVHKEGVGRVNLYDCGMTGRCAQLAIEAGAQLFGNDVDDLGWLAKPEVYIGFLPLLALNLAAMFGICLLCHGELVRQRPATRYLTSFYVMIAAGGALGGAAVTLVAPRVFTTFFEWNLSLFLATIGVLVLILNALVNRAVSLEPGASRQGSSLAARLALVVLLLPASFVLLDVVEFLHSGKRDVRYQGRNFFGTITIRERNVADPRTNNFVMLHGITVHGSQFTAPERRGQPTTYYGTPSGIGILLNRFRAKHPQGGMRIGAVGLGTGTLAAFAGEGDSICFYEIDTEIVDITTSARWFTYVRDCQARGAHCEIKLGDGRLTLEGEQANAQPPRYHVLVADAFSGDAVPIHLLTIEAFELYFARLASKAVDGEDGALAVNVSNRYLDLGSVMRAAAQHFGVGAVLIESPGIADQSINSADWVIFSRDEALLEFLAKFGERIEDTPGPPVLWTDARSSLFEVLK